MLARPMTARQTADFFQVSIRTLYGWIRDGKLGHIRTPGGEYRILPEHIEAVCRDAAPTTTDYDNEDETASGKSGTGTASPREAYQRGLQIERKLKRGGPASSPADATVAEILAAYLADYRARKGRVTHWYGVALTRELGDLRPADITDPVIYAYIDRRRTEGRSDGTIRRELAGTLRPALALVARWGWIDKAPYIPAPAEPPPRDRWLTREQWAEFRTACATTPHLETFAVLALYTASRTGAILSLPWAGVNWDLELIDFGADAFAGTKKRRGVVPMSAPVREQLETVWRWRTTDQVIEWRGRPVASVKNAFGRAAERAGVAWLHPHLLRHTAATWMAIDGVPIEEIARFLADDIHTTEKRYAKFSPDYLRRAANSLAKPISCTRTRNIRNQHSVSD